jgi:hypothetical protein
MFRTLFLVLAFSLAASACEETGDSEPTATAEVEGTEAAASSATPLAATATPPPSPTPIAPTATPFPSETSTEVPCHPSYQGACLDPNASDYDCAGGSGNGPLYTGPVTVVVSFSHGPMIRQRVGRKQLFLGKHCPEIVSNTPARGS